MKKKSFYTTKLSNCRHKIILCNLAEKIKYF